MSVVEPAADPAGGAGRTGDHGGMATGWVLVMAGAAVLGAWASTPVPVPAAVAVAAVGLAGRWPPVLVAGVGLLAAGLGWRAADGLDPLAVTPFAGVVELVTDPEPAGPVGWRAEARLPGGARVQAVAHGPAAGPLRDAVAGGRLDVEGRLRPLARRTAWTDSRHLRGALDVDQARSVDGGTPLARLAQAVRAAVEAGAGGVPERLRPLYTGLVVGDDRFQPAGQQAAFRAAGLTHLLAVSGQNVAFVMLVAGPVLRRLGTWPRLAAVAGLLVLFATVTRFEPSVLRATTTAGLAAWSLALGRPNRGLRVLALAVAALVLVDPLLVRSVGFQLSVAASAGILALGPPMQRLVPAPTWLREPLVVTAAAQLAVLPLLTGVFGPVSLVSVPANLLVSGAAGVTMAWGLTVGVVAGVVPDGLGQVLQLPATWSLWWIDAVARQAATTPAPRLGAAASLPVVGGVLWLLWGPRWRRVGLVAAAAALVLAPAGGGGAGAVPGGRWCPDIGGWDVLVLEQPARAPALLEALLERGVRRVDVVVSTGGSATHGRAVAQLRQLLALGPVLAPPRHQVRGARSVTAPTRLGGGPLLVEPVDRAERLAVTGPC